MSTISSHILILISCMIPAMIANATPVIVRKIPILQYPIRESWLGAHKTWRWLISGTIVGTIIGYILLSSIQSQIINSWILHFYANNISPLLMSFLLSFGALFGDSFKSYWKRRYHIPSGQPFIPRDQIDYIIGTFMLTCWWINWSYLDFIIMCVLGWILSYSTHYLWYLLWLINTKH